MSINYVCINFNALIVSYVSGIGYFTCKVGGLDSTSNHVFTCVINTVNWTTPAAAAASAGTDAYLPINAGSRR